MMTANAAPVNINAPASQPAATLEPPPSTFAHVTAELATKGAHATGVVELSRGANAVVYSFQRGDGASATVADDDDAGERVALCDVAIKVGRWPSAKAFETEVALHRTAAAVGCAPRLLYASAPRRAAATGALVAGELVIERLTQPTFFRWLLWLSLEQRGLRGSRDRSWRVGKEALRTPIFQTWAAEVKRLAGALVSANVSHGDWHERNLVFHVPALKERTAVGQLETYEHHAQTKALIMRAIAAGPGAGLARLYVIDYGSAKPLTGRVGRFIVRTLGHDRHLVDASEEPPSPSAHDRRWQPPAQPAARLESCADDAPAAGCADDGGSAEATPCDRGGRASDAAGARDDRRVATRLTTWTALGLTRRTDVKGKATASRAASVRRGPRRGSGSVGVPDETKPP